MRVGVRAAAGRRGLPGGARRAQAGACKPPRRREAPEGGMNYRAEIARLRSGLEDLRSVATAAADPMASDPAALMEAAGMTPDPWQRDLLRSESRRKLVMVTRQGGKSTTTAAKALHRAL